MKPFVFKEFEVKQSENVFRVGTDAVLLGALSSVENSKRVLEVGVGTGIISLMLAQREKNANVLGIDINEAAVSLCVDNFKNSPFCERLDCLCVDFKSFKNDYTFDFVVSNPPYFHENPSQKDKIARQLVAMDFKNLISKTKEVLSDNGVFSVILPAEVSGDFIKYCWDEQMYLVRKINIKGIASGKVKRNILEFQKDKYVDVLEEEFVIEESPRLYSSQYLSLTKDFHVFK